MDETDFCGVLRVLLLSALRTPPQTCHASEPFTSRKQYTSTAPYVRTSEFRGSLCLLQPKQPLTTTIEPALFYLDRRVDAAEFAKTTSPS